MTAPIYYFGGPVKSEFINYFENTMQITLLEAGAFVLAYFITEESPNTFPRLPVREGEHVFVWFAGFEDQAAYERHTTELAKSKLWKTEISKFLNQQLEHRSELLKLSPTPRSWLTGRPYRLPDSLPSS